MVTNYGLEQHTVPESQRVSLMALQKISGVAASLLAEHSNLIVTDQEGRAVVYTILSNKAHANITSLFREEKYRLPKEDTLTVAYGVVGDYPNAFFHVSELALPDFVAQVRALRTESDYQSLKTAYGIRRSAPNFWAHSDMVHSLYEQQQPDMAGWLDYSRIENR